MYMPWNYGFGSGPAIVDEASDKTDMWQEIVSLREKLAAADKATLEAEKKIEIYMKATVVNNKHILVLKGSFSEKEFKEYVEAWGKYHPTGMVMGLPVGTDLATLDDQDLSDLGLRKVGSSQVSDRDLYDADLLGYKRR
jgi:hypothetical protein